MKFFLFCYSFIFQRDTKHNIIKLKKSEKKVKKVRDVFAVHVSLFFENVTKLKKVF